MTNQLNNLTQVFPNQENREEDRGDGENQCNNNDQDGGAGGENNGENNRHWGVGHAGRFPWLYQQPREHDHFDEASKRIRVDVPDYHRSLNPNSFQDWLISLEDYFEWFNMATEKKVQFVRMKLKGQVRVWWQSIEEQLHRHRQATITDWEDMKLCLKEKLDSRNSCFLKNYWR
ncbi:hypothetical protein I3842_04G113300 [Carya illinoinensis]|uniref:Retrotransposon gag domain-containing protein n=1 Tax=Carya illinoinensis TaxID=32201 RepID=A0A922FBD3_CARIL|nr:hypothetical protein I3842_04G113300 [Carya illinoinensis]